MPRKHFNRKYADVKHNDNNSTDNTQNFTKQKKMTESYTTFLN